MCKENVTTLYSMVTPHDIFRDIKFNIWLEMVKNK